MEKGSFGNVSMLVSSVWFNLLEGVEGVEEKRSIRTGEAGRLPCQAVHLQGCNHPSGHLFPICTEVLWGCGGLGRARMGVTGGNGEFLEDSRCGFWTQHLWQPRVGLCGGGQAWLMMLPHGFLLGSYQARKGLCGCKASDE